MKNDLLRCAIIAALGIPLPAAAQPGAIDGAFAANIQTGGGANSSVYCMATDGAGNTFIGGAFTQFAGAPANRIAKVLPDGTLAAPFTSAVGLVGNDVKAIAVQPDGKILIGGNFSTVGGISRPNIARLNADGTLDTGFAPALNLPVFCIALQTDGGIVVGGQFFFNPGFTRRGVIRLLPDGTTDTSFNPGAGANSTVNTVDVDASGRIVIGGAFTSYNGAPANHLALLDANGSAHAAFASGTGLDGPANAVDAMDDGRILVGGDFDQYDGVPCPALICLTHSGSAHATMITNGFDASAIVWAIRKDLNGLAVVAGAFSTYDGEPRSRILRLLDNGDLDPNFDVGSGFTGTVVVSLSSDPLGPILAGGTFNAYRGTPQNNLTRIDDCLQHHYYADTDGDGFGDGAVSAVACAPPSGHVLDNSDCDDNNLSVTGPLTWYADSDGDGAGDPTSPLLACSAPSGYVADNTDCDDQDVERYAGAPCDDGDPTTVSDTLTSNCTCVGGAVDVAAKVILDGPFSGSLMNDGLRAAGLIPLTEPYTGLGFHPAEAGGGEQIAASVLTTTGPNAIVDWVMICLRDDAPPYPRTKIRMALLQRDGDIVDLDGVSPVRFAQMPGPYMLEVRHRNHLGIMSAQPMPEVPTGTVLTVDFTQSATACYGTDARKIIGPVRTMWAGNTVNNTFLSYTGVGNDRDVILSYLGSQNPNGVSGPVYIAQDVSMDGQVRYTGSGNDRDPILFNIGSLTPNNIRQQQVP